MREGVCLRAADRLGWLGAGVGVEVRPALADCLVNLGMRDTGIGRTLGLMFSKLPAMQRMLTAILDLYRLASGSCSYMSALV